MKLLVAVLSMLILLSTVVAAEELKDVQFTVEKNPLFKPQALIPDKGVYTPGETVTITFGCYVPAQTRYVYFRVASPSGGQVYYKDMSSLFSPSTCMIVKASFTAPSTTGQYTTYADFRDGDYQVIYSDQGTFTVAASTSTCPYGYCTDWKNFQRVEFGWLQTKSCYTVAQNPPACTTTAYNAQRTVCDNGYELVNNHCVLPNNQPTCGDGIKQSGEQCDLGTMNSVCPSTCNAFCQTANCQDIPGFDECTDPFAPGCTDKPGNGGGGDNNTVLYIASALLLVGGVLLVRKK